MSHLTQEQRYTIGSMKQEGYSQKEIAVVIGKSASVVSRELQRNCDKRSGEYRPVLAQKKCEQRHKEKAKKCYFTKEIQSYVEEKLALKYSPEQIKGEANRLGKSCVSAERIYQYVWADKRKGGKLYEHLRTQGKRYRKRGSAKDKRGIIPHRRDISERPTVVEEKSRIGDLEIDTIIGANHKGAILTINDRRTGMLIMRKLSGKNAQELAEKTVDALQEWKPFLHTITADNGKEFAEHLYIAQQLNIDFFFATPYHSWERGANENLNGLIRQYIPKKANFDDYSDQFINFVQEQINNRPRKRHGFEPPNTVHHQQIAFIT